MSSALALGACAADNGVANAGASILQDSYEAGKNAAINTGINAVTGKLTGTNSSSMSNIAKETANSGKNAAIQKATSSLTGATVTE